MATVFSYKLWSGYQLLKTCLCDSKLNYMLWPQKTFNIVHYLWTNTFFMCSSHNQPLIYSFCDIVILLSSSPGTALHLIYRATVYELWKESRKTWRSKPKWHVYQNCFISPLLLLTLLVSFRVGFIVAKQGFSQVKSPLFI